MVIERNEGMLRKVGDYIAENPERYDQGTWATNLQKGLGEDSEQVFLACYGHVRPTCGTRFCIAGATMFLSPDFKRFEWDGVGITHVVLEEEEATILTSTFDVMAAERLGLEMAEADKLFGGGWWPKRFTPGQAIGDAVKEALYRIADGASVEDVSGLSGEWW